MASDASAAPEVAAAPRFSFTGLPYPGPFEFLHKECKDVFTLPFLIDGAKVVVNKPINNNFQVSHTIALGGVAAPPSYHFGATYVGQKKSGPGEQYPVLLGDLDTDGNLIAQAIHEFAPGFKGKLQAQMAGPNWGAQWEADIKGGDFHASVKAVNPSLIDKSGIVIANYLQSVTENISVGGEFMTQFSGPMKESGFSAAIRYKGKDFIATANASPAGSAQATYVHRVNEKVSIGAELECNLRTMESIVTAGYHFDLRQASFRGQIDSGGVVSAVLEQKMAPGISFLMTGSIDHVKGQSRFGMGLSIGGQ